MPDGRIVIPQGGDIRLVGSAGGESVVLSDRRHAPDQTVSCGGGKYIVFRSLGRSGNAAINLWRVDPGGSDQKQLTFGRNESSPQCSRDGKWVYYVAVLENQALKRVPVEGGRAETVFDSPSDGYDLSPDGKTAATLEVREFDHKLTLQLYSLDDKKESYRELDQRASQPFAFTPEGNAVVYTVREKGVDNLWLQPLDSSPHRQLTHFTMERIARFAFSPDGSTIAIERGHLESDAVLLTEASK
jgi:Tol biopolymer transport system component